MGGCTCSAAKVVVSRMQLQQAVAAAIEEDDLKTLIDLYSAFMQRGQMEGPCLGLDDPIVSIQGFPLNALAYTFRLGHKAIAEFLLQQAGCDLGTMYSMYKVAGKSPVTILCEYGHLALLQYFLPIHLELERGLLGGPVVSFQDQSESISLFPEDLQAGNRRNWLFSQSGNTQSAVHRACEHGHLEIITYTYNYLEQHPPTPQDLDIHAEDEKTGENCALIAARTGNLALMEFLLQVCRADFRKLTKSRESAIHLAVFGSKYYKNRDFLPVLRFLVAQAEVDLLYEYEETLLLCDNPILQAYIEYQLLIRGIAVKKAALEEKFAIGQDRGTRFSASFVELEARIEAMGPNFQLEAVFHRELVNSQPSSISPRSITPFSMLSRVITPN